MSASYHTCGPHAAPGSIMMETWRGVERLVDDIAARSRTIWNMLTMMTIRTRRILDRNLKKNRTLCSLTYL